jgi:maltooligosyltrehalose trehalohydrolase
MSLGAEVVDDASTRFRVWAPAAERVDVRIVAPEPQTVPMRRASERGYWEATAEGVGPGARYWYVLDGRERPDPASRWQPDGVHGPSAVVDPAFGWTDSAWRGRPIEQYVVYELHVGTFAGAGTFDAAIAELSRLADLGITAVELMPVGEFPGARNWGYDGVFPFAAQSTYGGPDGLRRFVDAAHRHGLCVVLDVVYNHLGPEGNVLADFGPYFTSTYSTPWGDALNFDGRGSDEVRSFFVENALVWVSDFHVDGLRLDAVHAIVDPTARPFVQELAEAVQVAGRSLDRFVTVIAESAANDVRLVRGRDAGGMGLDAVWSDDFHHALHALVTGERASYYGDYGTLDDLARAYAEAFVYDGRYSPYRGRRHGSRAVGVRGERFVVCGQNHDQVGNRPAGERLTALVDPARLRLVAAAVVLSPFVPMLFMGEEYGETAPFPYFVSHTDPGLVEAVRDGRRREMAGNDRAGEPPDPQAEATFASAKLTDPAQFGTDHRALLDWYRRLLELRRTVPALAELDPGRCRATVQAGPRVLVLRRGTDAPGEVAVVLSFEDAPAKPDVALPPGEWRVLLASPAGSAADADELVGSDGAVSLELAPWAVLVLQRSGD